MSDDMKKDSVLRKLMSRSRKGYTLAELLMVVAILGVLAGLSFIAVSRYRRTLKLLEMDKTAQEIYIAAQNHMTQASTGALFQKQVKEELEKGGSSVLLGSQMTTEPMDWDSTEYGSWDDMKDDMYFIQYNSSLAGDSASILEDSILQYILPFGAIDDTIRRDYQYVIEYNAASDAIYAVYYTDSKEATLDEIVMQG
ncbi:MAG: prepilin-type N-terminal cleavage/methylation domain-containing protein, partial [Lachnospiraceae bacterium]|nr:prepilin-type N-terminal cleavage/methylation domain-containing protein [Lachnospiraceae bacterium]